MVTKKSKSVKTVVTESKTTATKANGKKPAPKKVVKKKVEETKSREQIEYDRLSELYIKIPNNKRQLVDGLLWQAARLRVSLDDLYAFLEKNGNTEMFKQAYDGVEFPRERPESKIFATRDKSYLAIIKKLDELLPVQEAKSGFSKLLEDD